MITLLPFTLDDYVNFDDWITSEEELIQFGGEIFSYPITNSQMSDYLADKNRFLFKVMCYEKVGMTIVPDIFKSTHVGSEVWTTVRMGIKSDNFYNNTIHSN